MKTFRELIQNLKLEAGQHRKLRIALLGDSATQLLAKALRGAAWDYDLSLDLWEADFDQIERQVFDSESELYRSNPEFVVLFYSSHMLLNKFRKLDEEGRAKFAAAHLSSLEQLYTAIRSHCPAKVICYNLAEIDDAVFGNFANKLESSFPCQLRSINFGLMSFARQAADFHICDLSAIQNSLGRQVMFSPAVYVNTGMVLTLDALPAVACRTLDIVAAVTGRFKKCLILDLDNTLWGGVIGDDGLEHIQLGNLGIGKAFTEFQYWIKSLKERGVILAVCSKNDEKTAKEPFEKHPDMVLRLDDIAVFVANWENKADNIRRIQRVLNIGFDSMVFVDDNPFERGMVRENVPGLTVPELPEDPADYLEFMYAHNFFETVSFSNLDKERTRQYQAESERLQAQEKFVNEEDFLASLRMVSDVSRFSPFNTPRVAQLSQRSNQFNLRTVRYSEGDIEALAHDPAAHTFAFTLRDKFGDNGLIGVIVLKARSSETCFIETWLMSCRVLKRGMEVFTLNTIAAYARERGFSRLVGEYLPTPKNGMVKDHYRQLGFEPSGHEWTLDLRRYQPAPCFITKSD